MVKKFGGKYFREYIWWKIFGGVILVFGGVIFGGVIFGGLIFGGVIFGGEIRWRSLVENVWWSIFGGER
jgi:hypothetical protein